VRLRITTPLAIAVDADDVRHVRAEDATGAFGIQPHHGRLITHLAISVVTWRDGAGREHHVAVRGGVLATNAEAVDIATREATAGDDLEQLERDVIARFHRQEATEQAARGGAARIELAAIRRICDYLRGERTRVVIGEDTGDDQP
jgi:F-type H+-transporting ATPase subunit epsilon